MKYILAINPGSTSSKIAVFEDETCLFEDNIKHSHEALEGFSRIQDQFEFRKNEVLRCLEDHSFDINLLSAVVGRGGLLPPVKSGAYYVNDAMLERLIVRPIAEHASNLGAIIADSIAKPLGVDAMIYDSVAVDEMHPVARITGLKEITRKSLFHALNSRSVAIEVASKKNGTYNSMTFIVAHLGGGITISLHHQGKIIDIISDDEGPFSPERAGRIPTRELIKLCYSGKYEEKTLVKMTRGGGGIKSLLDTTDIQQVENLIRLGNEDAKLYYEAMFYQVAKGIGELSTVVDGKVDQIILTGGIAHSKTATAMITKKVSFISEVVVIPGENEMKALALGCLRVLNGEEKANVYSE